MATSIPIDEIDDRIMAIEQRETLLNAIIQALQERVHILEQAVTPSPSGTAVILPIIGYHIIYTVP